MGLLVAPIIAFVASGVDIIELCSGLAHSRRTKKENSQADLLFDLQKRAAGHRD